MLLCAYEDLLRAPVDEAARSVAPGDVRVAPPAAYPRRVHPSRSRRPTASTGPIHVAARRRICPPRRRSARRLTSLTDAPR
jgi:hypothetical protein